MLGIIYMLFWNMLGIWTSNAFITQRGERERQHNTDTIYHTTRNG